MFRNIVMPFLTSVLTLSLMVFVSCAHNTTSDEADVDSSDASSQEGTADAPQEAGVDDTNSSETAKKEDGTPADDMTSADETPKAENADGEDALNAAKADAPPPQDVTDESPKKDQAAVEDQESIKEQAKLGSGDEMLSEIENPSSKAPIVANEQTSGESSPEGATLSGISPIGSAGGGTGVVSRLPHIKKVAIQSGKASLNRFYFMRQGDDPSKLATLLLGGVAGVADLKRWNPGAWIPGRLIYYASPVDPADKKMQSFYDERNVKAEPYTIGRGDWLSKISAKRYGSPKSWKEIAVLNGIKNPDSIEKGTKINLIPVDLSGYSGVSQLAQKKDLPQDSAPVSQPNVATNNAPAQNQVPAPQVEAEAPPQTPPGDIPAPGSKNSKGPHSFEIAELVSQNILFIAVGAAILLLGVALVALKKKKGKASDEFGEDPMAPPKARQKK